MLAGTWPNRYYKWSAQSGGVKNNRIAEGGNNWETIFDRATARGLSVRYYYSDLPFGALWGGRSVPWLAPISRYYEDAAAGKLPNIAIVDPPFKDGSGGDGLSADEHPLGDIRLGQAFQADVAGAFVKSPNYKRGAMFVMYDEWGGFFDHVKPPRVPDDRASADLNEDFGQMGFRIPAIAISPYSRNVHPALARTLLAGQPQVARRPRALRPRVDPQLHQLPVRAGLPDQAPPDRQQHRQELQLVAARLRPARSYPTHRRS